MALQARWRELCGELTPKGVQLLAVSKYSEDMAVECLIAAGQRDFGESRPQALRDRAEKYPECRWHMIGPLQKNKAKYVGRHAAMWQSLCDLETAEAVARHVEGRRLPVLVQVNISDESQKQGVAPEALPALLQALTGIEQLEVCGLMGMAAKTGGEREAFRQLRDLRERAGDGKLRELCMGMSGDWKVAVEEGATMVRLGSVLFGAYRQGE